MNLSLKCLMSLFIRIKKNNVNLKMIVNMKVMVGRILVVVEVKVVEV